MPSTISDFNLQAKNQRSELRVGIDYNNQNQLALSKYNYYQRQITIDNTGKSSKTNYVCAIQINHRSLFEAYKSGYIFNDLRVYDSDGATPLSFHVQSCNTVYCIVYVLLPSLASSNKTIYLEYGNKMLPSISSLSSVLPIFADSRLKYWFAANQFNRFYWDGNITAFTPSSDTQVWENLASGVKRAYHVGTTLPIVNNFLNGLPVITFNANQKHVIRYSADVFANGHSFCVIKPSIVNVSTIIGSGGTNSTALRHRIDSDSGALKQRLVGRNDISNYDSTVLSSSTFSSINVSYSSNNWAFRTNGANGSSGTTVAVPAITDRTDTIGASFNPGEGLNGDVAEIILFNDALSSADRDAVEAYLNEKYRLYNTSDLPEYTIGAETNLSPSTFSLSYAPFASYSCASKLKNRFYGLAPAEGEAEIQNVFVKTLAIGDSLETWSASTVDINQFCLHNECRKRVVNNLTASYDEVTIERIEGGNNYGDASKFELTNDIEATSYPSIDSDYITLDFYAVASLNLTASAIKFRNSAGTLSYTINFSQNLNGNVNNQLNTLQKLRFRKSDFTKSGTGTWTDVQIFGIRVVASSSTTNVYYGYVQLLKNIETQTEFVSGQPITLGVAVSSDSGASWYNHTALTARIQSRQIVEEDIKLNFSDYLELLKNIKFGDLPGFPTNFCVFNNRVGLVDQGFQKWHTNFLRWILNFIFPDSYLDINLDFLPTNDNIGVGTMGGYAVYTSDTVGSIIDKILTSCFGVLTFDQKNQKIIARSGYKVFDNTIYTTDGLQLETPYNINKNIRTFKRSSEDTDLLYNLLRFQNFLALGSDASLGFKPCVVFTDSYELKPNAVTYMFFDDANFLFGSKNGGKTFVLANPELADWGVCPGPTDDILAGDNTGVVINSVKTFDNKIVVEFNNTNSSLRYLRAAYISATCLQFRRYPAVIKNSNDSTNEYDYILSNSASITKYGKKEFVIDPLFSFNGNVLASTNFAAAQLYSEFLNQFSLTSNIAEIELVRFDPEIRIGRVVQYLDNSNRLVNAHVLEYQHYSENDDVQKIKVREIL